MVTAAMLPTQLTTLDSGCGKERLWMEGVDPFPYDFVGDRYVGAFQNDKYHGEGDLTMHDGK